MDTFCSISLKIYCTKTNPEELILKMFMPRIYAVKIAPCNFIKHPLITLKQSESKIVDTKLKTLSLVDRRTTSINGLCYGYTQLKLLYLTI